MKTCLLYILFFITSIYPKSITLFDLNFEPLKNYNNIINNISINDEFIFPNGHKYLIKNIAGNGITSIIFEVTDKNNVRYALRIARRKRYVIHIDSWYDGYKGLKKFLKNLPKIFSSKKKSKSMFILEEFINIDYTLNDYIIFLSKNKKSNDLPYIKLTEFFESTYILQHISDFRLDQVAYSSDKKKWILLDFLRYSTPVIDNNTTILDQVLDDFMFKSSKKYQYMNKKIKTILNNLRNAILIKRLYNENQLYKDSFKLIVENHNNYQNELFLKNELSIFLYNENQGQERKVRSKQLKVLKQTSDSIITSNNNLENIYYYIRIIDYIYKNKPNSITLNLYIEKAFLLIEREAELKKELYTHLFKYKSYLRKATLLKLYKRTNMTPYSLINKCLLSLFKLL